MAEERLFGNSIDKAVVDEIKKREKLFSKGDASNKDLLPADPDNLKSLRYTTQRGAWVRMISSVNVKVPNSDAFSSELSKNFILTGGEITSAGTQREGISFETDRNTTKSYRKTATVGVRPESGITSFSIKHKGTYGSLREAEISFNVWSKEDLNVAQDIYLRPGIHVILEWGHTIDSDGNLTSLPIPEKYFTANSRQAVQDLINAHRKTNLSYEGFIGLVTNFSWSFREDGGYDCSLRVISIGAIMEALTVINNKALTTSTELTKLELKDEDLQDTARKSELHLFYTFLQKLVFSPVVVPNTVANDIDLVKLQQGVSANATYLDLKIQSNLDFFPQKIQEIIKATPSTFFTIIGVNHNVTGAGNDAPDNANRFRYISLRHLFMFLNETKILPNDTERTKLVQLYTKQTTRDPNTTKLSTVDEPVFRTMPEHFSLDPAKVLLPKSVPPSLSINSLGIEELERLGVQQELEQQTLQQIFPPAQIPDAINQIIGGSSRSSSILDIFVEMGYVLSIFDKFFTQVNDNVYNANVFSFLQELLKGINYYLGNINFLDLHFDDTLGKYLVVDRELIAERLTAQTINELSFSGVSNTVSKVSIQTKITPLLSSQIAISAQGSSTLVSGEVNSNLPLIQWNANIEDRYNKKIPQPQPPNTSSTESLPSTTSTAPAVSTAVAPPQALQEFRDSIDSSRTNAVSDSYLDSFLVPMERAYLNFKKFTQPSYKEKDFQKLHSKGVSYFKERSFINILEAEGTSDPGLIPIELSVTLDGIGGLKIGQVFKLNRVDKFLPDVYRNYGFILTAIDSSIENNKWYTTLKALTFKIPNSVRESTAGAGGAASSSNTGSLSASVDTYIEKVPWSAGFISFIVGPVVNTFPSSGLHTTYAQNLRTNTPEGWEVLNPFDNKPIAGDIVVRNSARTNPPSSPISFGKPWTGSSHGDIVISATNDAITYIGGNLSDTVSRGTINRAFLPTDPNRALSYFVILRPPQSSRATIVARANAEFNKWNRAGWKENTPAAYSTIYTYYEIARIHRLRRASDGTVLTPLPRPTA